MLDSEKGTLTLGSFQNFAYVNSYLHLKSLEWKRGCPVSPKLQTSVDQGHSRKLLQSSTKLHLNGRR